MTTTASGRKLTSACNGVTTLFTVPKLLTAGDLRVYLLDAVGDANADGTLLSEGDDYTVAADLGSITTLGAPLPAGKYIRRWRDTSRAQGVSIKANEGLPAATQEAMHDRLSLIDEEHDDDLGRAITAAPGEGGQVLPSRADFKGKYLAGDANGNLVPAVGTGADGALRADLAAVGGADLVGKTGGGSVQDYIDNPGALGPLVASFGALLLAFSNANYYSSAQYLTNGAAPGAWYNAAFAGNNATEALTAAIVTPVGATNLQTNAGAFYVRSDRARIGSGGEVAGFFFAHANHDGAVVFTLNTVAQDTIGKINQILGNELDFNVSVPATTVNGINLVIVSTLGAALTGDRNAIFIQGAFHDTSTWSNGLVTVDGRIDLYAALIGSQTAAPGSNRESQKIGFVGYTAGNVRHISAIRGDQNGGLQFLPATAGATIAFLDDTASTFWAYIDANGFTLPEKAVGAVAAPAAGFQTLFIDSADHKVKRKNSANAVTILA
jgi:hypothetical protein